MSTPVERQPSQTLDSAPQVVSEPPADLIEGVKRQKRRRRYLATASAATAVAVVTIATLASIESASRHSTMTGAASPRGDAGIEPSTATPATIVTDRCTMQDLPLPPPQPGQRQIVAVTDIDSTGRYIAGYTGDGDTSRPVLWVDGKLQLLDGLGYATGVNATGTVVGWSTAGGWVYRDSRSAQLPKPPSPDPGLADPTAINNRGDIVGGSTGATIWPADQPGQVRLVGDGLLITGISDDGLMVGEARSSETRLWNRDGTVRAQPPGFQPRLVAGPWVLGQVDIVVNGDARYALWNLTTGAMIPLNADGTVAARFWPDDLSESGAVLITLLTGQGRPAIFHDGEVILLPLPKGQTNIQARAISGDGRTIIGNEGPRTRVLLWRC